MLLIRLSHHHAKKALIYCGLPRAVYELHSEKGGSDYHRIRKEVTFPLRGSRRGYPPPLSMKDAATARALASAGDDESVEKEKRKNKTGDEQEDEGDGKETEDEGESEVEHIDKHEDGGKNGNSREGQEQVTIDLLSDSDSDSDSAGDGGADNGMDVDDQGDNSDALMNGRDSFSGEENDGEDEGVESDAGSDQF